MLNKIYVKAFTHVYLHMFYGIKFKLCWFNSFLPFHDFRNKSKKAVRYLGRQAVT